MKTVDASPTEKKDQQKYKNFLIPPQEKANA